MTTLNRKSCLIIADGALNEDRGALAWTTMEEHAAKVANRGKKKVRAGIGTAVAHIELAAAIEGWKECENCTEKKIVTDDIEARNKICKGNRDMSGKLGELWANVEKHKMDELNVGKISKKTGKIEGLNEAINKYNTILKAELK